MNALRYADMFIGISVGMLAVVSLVESQMAALVASDRLFGRESDSGSEVDGSSEERTTATWIRGVVDSLAESRQRLWLRVINSLEENWTAALKWLAFWQRGRQQLGLEEWSTLWQRVDSGSFQQIRQ